MTELTRDHSHAWVDEVVREMPGLSAMRTLEEVMRRSKGSVNPKTAMDLIYAAKGLPS